MDVIIIDRYRHYFTVTFCTAILACWLVFPGSAKAFNVKPVQLYLLQDTVIYNNHDVNPGKPVGVISANQSVNVVGLDKDLNDRDPAEWYLVETWLGDKWLKADTLMVNGTLQKADKEISTVYNAALYEHPDPKFITNLSISPQKLHSTASISYGPMHFDDTFGAAAGSGIWYRIDTWLGERF
jgi:hypothetical protein